MKEFRSLTGRNVLMMTGAVFILSALLVNRVEPGITRLGLSPAFFINGGWRVLLLGICLLLLDRDIPMMTSAGLIVLAFVVNWVELSVPWIMRLTPAMLLGGGLRVLILGICLLLIGRHLRDMNLSQFPKSLINSIRLRWKDISLASVLFGLAVAVAFLYLFWSVHQVVYTDSILFAVVIVLAYSIFRLGMGRLLSFVCSLSFIVSSNHLANLYNRLDSRLVFQTYTRDYTKVPFVLATFLLMGLLVSRPLKRAQLFSLSVIGGLILGFGLLVRQDLIVFILPFILLLFLFLPGSIKNNIKIKFAAFLLFAIGFLWFANPTNRQQTSIAAYRAISGFMTTYNDRLGVTRPEYDWGYLFIDEFAFSISWSHHYSKDIQPSLYTKEYNQAGYNYLLNIARNFPADILTRVYAAVLKILELPFTYIEPPPKIMSNLILDFYALRARILNLFAGTGFFWSVAALLMISTNSLRKAIFCLCFLLYFAGYPILLFQGRHYFHMEIITWWTLGFVIQRSISALGQLVHRFSKGDLAELFTLSKIRCFWTTSGQRCLGFAVGSLMVILIPLLALRQYQSWHVGNLLREYSHAEKERLPLVQIPLANNVVLISSPEYISKSVPENSVSADYLVAEFGGDQCGYSTAWPVFRYASDWKRCNFSRSVSINLADSEVGATQIFFPAISYNFKYIKGQHSTHFKGIEMTQTQASCLRALYLIKDPNRLPMLLTATVSPGSEHSNLYQKIASLEANEVYTVPINMSDAIVKNLLERSVLPLTADDVDFHDEIVHIGADQWVIKGYATPQNNPYMSPTSDRTHSTLARASFVDVNAAKIDTDLLITKKRLLREGSYFIAQGKLYTGGVTFGLIKDGRTAGYVNVVDRGPFTIIIEVPEKGLYSLGLANNLDLYTSLENRFLVTKVGWISPQ